VDPVGELCAEPVVVLDDEPDIDVPAPVDVPVPAPVEVPVAPERTVVVLCGTEVDVVVVAPPDGVGGEGINGGTWPFWAATSDAAASV
jgi:hypothetical protein